MIKLNNLTKLPKEIKLYWLFKIVLLMVLPFLVSLISLLAILRVKFIFILIVFFGFSLFVILPIVFLLLLYYKFFSFLVEEDKITINYGLIVKHSKSIPFQTIQKVENVRGVFDSFFGFSQVNIWTASPEQINLFQGTSTHKPEASLLLLTKDGEWLKNFILSKRS